MLGETLGVRMARVSPMAQQPFSELGHTPNQPQTDLSGMNTVADFIALELWRKNVGRSRDSEI